MTLEITISESTFEDCERRLVELVKARGAVSFTRVLFRGNRYIVKVKIIENS